MTRAAAPSRARCSLPEARPLHGDGHVCRWHIRTGRHSAMCSHVPSHTECQSPVTFFKKHWVPDSCMQMLGLSAHGAS